MKVKSPNLTWLPFLFYFLCMVGMASCSSEKEIKQNTEKGPHHGRLLRQGPLTLELAVFEKGMPPHFRAYLYKDGKPLNMDGTHLTIKLRRFAGTVDTITFEPVNDFLQSQQTIQEPHSFEVTIHLINQDKNYEWHYASYEGRMHLGAPILKAAGIETAVAKEETIKKQLKVVGKIVPNRDTSAPVYPRYSGIIKSMTKKLGDKVSKGDVLATIESNESLQNYTVSAPINGIVVQKQATSGELAKGDRPIYELADLMNVWADLTLYRKEAPLVKAGMDVIVTGDEGKPRAVSTISYISPLGIEDSQTVLARSILSNESNEWLPGMYVNAAIVIQEKTVAVAVPRDALQHVGQSEVVFVQQGDDFEATPVVIGDEDDAWVEIRSGLKPGQRYVSKNSFFLKAELGKSGASHEH